MKNIYRVMKIQDWDLQFKSKHITDPSLETEGFIHCCFEDQLMHVLSNYFFTGDELIIHQLDPKQLKKEIKIEGKLGEEGFPHVYCKIPFASIIDSEIIMNPF